MANPEVAGLNLPSLFAGTTDQQIIAFPAQTNENYARPNIARIGIPLGGNDPSKTYEVKGCWVFATGGTMELTFGISQNPSGPITYLAPIEFAPNGTQEPGTDPEFDGQTRLTWPGRWVDFFLSGKYLAYRIQNRTGSNSRFGITSLVFEVVEAGRD